jgi:WD40 repeat protein
MRKETCWTVVAALAALHVAAPASAQIPGPSGNARGLSPEQEIGLEVRSLSLARGGATYATVNRNGLVQVRNRKGNLLRAVQGVAGYMRAALSPDGAVLATIDVVKRLRTPAERKVEEAHHATINGVPVDVTYTFDGQMKFWDVRRGALIKMVAIDEGDLLFSPDSRLLATYKRAVMHIWNARTGALQRTIALDREMLLGSDGKPIGSGRPDSLNPMQAAWSPDGTTIALGGDAFFVDSQNNDRLELTEKVKRWDVRTGKLLSTFDIHDKGVGKPNYILDLAFSPDGRALATCVADASERQDYQVLFWSLSLEAIASAKKPRILVLHMPVGEIALLPDGKTVAGFRGGGNFSSPEITLWDIPTGERLRTIGPRFPDQQGGSMAMTFSPDKTLLAGVNSDGRLIAWQAQLQPSYVFTPIDESRFTQATAKN